MLLHGRLGALGPQAQAGEEQGAGPGRDNLFPIENRGEPMSGEGRMLTRQQAKVFYDRLGAKQDWQAFYEVPVTNNLIAHAALEQAQSVFEFGCGTGAFAERVLSHHLSPRVCYLAVDSSSTMVALARTRLARFGER